MKRLNSAIFSSLTQNYRSLNSISCIDYVYKNASSFKQNKIRIEIQWKKNFESITDINKKIDHIVDFKGEFGIEEAPKIFDKIKLNEENIERCFKLGRINKDLLKKFLNMSKNYIETFEPTHDNIKIILDIFRKYIGYSLKYDNHNYWEIEKIEEIVKLIILKMNYCNYNPNEFILEYGEYVDFVLIYNQMNLVIDYDILLQIFNKNNEFKYYLLSKNKFTL